MAASVVFTNAEIYLGGVEFTAQFNQVGLTYEAESLDETVFGLATRKMKGGLKHSVAQGSGFFQADGGSAVDPIMFDGVGVSDGVLTIFPDGITEGSTSTGIGYAFKVVQTTFNWGETVGTLLPFTFEAQGRGIKA